MHIKFNGKQGKNQTKEKQIRKSIFRVDDWIVYFLDVEIWSLKILDILRPQSFSQAVVFPSHESFLLTLVKIQPDHRLMLDTGKGAKDQVPNSKTLQSRGIQAQPDFRLLVVKLCLSQPHSNP